jgi:hypothetical protein
MTPNRWSKKRLIGYEPRIKTEQNVSGIRCSVIIDSALNDVIVESIEDNYKITKARTEHVVTMHFGRKDE